MHQKDRSVGLKSAHEPLAARTCVAWGLMIVLMVFTTVAGSAVSVLANDIVVIERVCSAEKNALNLALANIHNRVSETPAGIENGKSIEDNKAKMLKLVDLAKKKGVNMVLFPEFSLTGYFWPDPGWHKRKGPDPKSHVNLKDEQRKRDPHGDMYAAYDPKGYPSCWAYMNKGALDHHKDWLRKLKAELDDTLKYIIFNALRRDPSNPFPMAGPQNKFLNSTYVVDKDFDCEDLSKNEATHIYDKTFLPGIENVYERSGQDDVLVINTPWGRFGFTTCYDMCFSQLYETYGMKNRVDGVIQLASWRGPAVRAYPMMNIRTDQYYGYQWNIMAAARAITNQIWMIACNSVGVQHKGGYTFWGGSGLWAPSGIPLFQASSVEEQLCILHQVDIQNEVETEDDDFDFYDSFIEVYQAIPGKRAFTRMGAAPARSGSQ